MKSIYVDFGRRKANSNLLLSHIERLSSVSGNVDICIILKSSLYISIYNNVEATIYSILEKVHDEISSRHYSELIDTLKEKVADFHFGNQKVMSAKKKAILSEFIMSGRYHLPQLDEYQKFKTVFSGNLNLKKIRDIFKSYGISLGYVRGNPEHLLSVTNKRNMIAHGEQSLSEAGKTSNTSLRSVMKSVDFILEDTIIRAEDYIENKRYLIATTE